MISYNAEQVSEKDLLIAAQEIFESSEKDFQKIKSEKWYQTFFHAITLNQDGKKYVVNGVRSLAKLQQLFMTVYVKNYRDTHSQLNETIEGIKKTQEAVKQLYHSCVLHFEEQAYLSMLSSTDAEILALFLGEYRNSEGIVPENVQKYNCGVLTALHVNMPTGLLQQHQIAKLQKPEVVYRCFMEQCAVDGTIDTQEWTDQIYQDLDDLDLGPSRRRQIKESVKNEIEIAGIDYFFVKYSKEALDILDSDFEIAEDISASSAVKDENEADFEEKEIDTSIEREYLKISGIIPVTAKKVYENKDIHFSSAIIECSGALEFRNCTIHYNEDNGSRINLKEDASLSIFGCTVICHNRGSEINSNSSNRHSFISTCASSECKAIIRHSTFVDCVDYIDGHFSSIHFSDNECMDCCRNFLHINLLENGESLIRDCDFVFAAEPAFKPISSKWRSSSSCIGISDCHKGNGNIAIKMCTVTTLLNRNGSPCNYMGNVVFINIESYSNTDVQIGCCTFKNINHCIRGVSSVYDCLFVNCQDVINSIDVLPSLNCAAKISDSIFIDCNQVARNMLQGSQITRCHFYGGTQKKYITTKYDAAITIDACEFTNFSCGQAKGVQGYSNFAFTTFPDNSPGSKESRPEAIIHLSPIEKSQLKKTGATHISNCIFKEVRLAYDAFSRPCYLVSVTDMQDPVQFPIAVISGCIFQNCATSNSSREIIRQQNSYLGLFNRESWFNTINVYNCPGYNDVTDLAHYAAPSDCKLKLTDNEGNEFGSLRPEINLFAEDFVTMKPQMA